MICQRGLFVYASWTYRDRNNRGQIYAPAKPALDILPSFADKHTEMDEAVTPATSTQPIVPPQTPAAKPPYTGKKRGGLSKGLIQAYELRDLTHRLAKDIGSTVPSNNEEKTAFAREVAGLVRAWDTADNRVRIHRNKPLPGSLRPVAKVKRGSKPSLAPVPAPQEPVLPIIPQPV
jgi:hypothetical protein